MPFSAPHTHAHTLELQVCACVCVCVFWLTFAGTMGGEIAQLSPFIMCVCVCVCKRGYMAA